MMHLSCVSLHEHPIPLISVSFRVSWLAYDPTQWLVKIIIKK